ncbi:MAG: hypothetical protein H6716_26090 [Polyangiaceae bacterium]|nr:hypothetical protein [Polyangiaceae bacterium]
MPYDPNKAHDTLTDFCQQLVDLGGKIQREKLSAPANDHLGFMIATFAARQLDQLHAIGYLIIGESPAQAGILARTMLEGFALLYWAHANPDRALRWRAYCLVHDLNLLREKQAAGEHLNPNHEPELLDRLRSDAQIFLKKKARQNVTDQVLGDPSSYQDVWHVGDDGARLSISAIIETLDDEDGPKLREMYGSLSKYVHWGVVGLAPHLSRTPSGYSIDLQSEPRDALTAMAMGFQACMQTFLMLAVHFKLDQEVTNLSAIKNEYVRDLSSTLDSEE